MNVVILTPDRVGSTLLQRTLTVYMLRKGFNKPVVNLHELTNGLEKYYNHDLEMEMLHKPDDRGYYQTLDEVIELLDGVDHYKTSRLAHYHLVRRNDSIKDQLKLYEYLNKNFYIISCRRKNMFEHVLSWVIQSQSKQLNVYNPNQKVDKFDTIYKNGITANKETIEIKLNAYKEYIEWTDRHFDVQSYFNYEDSINNIEEYILNLDFMRNHKDNTWEDMFGTSFDIWNKVHKTIADLQLINDTENAIEIKIPKINHHDWDNLKGVDWPKELPLDLNNVESLDKEEIKHEIMNQVDYTTVTINKDKLNFLEKNIKQYRSIMDIQKDLVSSGFLVTEIPIKLQTFKEKKKLIKNYAQCIKWYNEWVTKNNFGEIYNEEEFKEIYKLEEQKHNNFDNLLSHKE